MSKNKKNQRFFYPSFFPKTRKGQMSEGISWVVATIAIIVILLFSVFITSKTFDFNDKTIPSESFSANLNEKSFMSYLLTKEPEGRTIYSTIKANENLGEFNGKLAVRIFEGLYGKEYLGIWVGFIDLDSWPEGRIGNDYFDRTSLIAFNGQLVYFTIKTSEDKGVSAEFITKNE